MSGQAVTPMLRPLPNLRVKQEHLLTEVAFVTIGQSPRDDVVPSILDLARTPIRATQFGVLDNLDEAALAVMAPGLDAPKLVSRLRSGHEIYLDKVRTTLCLLDMLEAIDRQGFDLIVLLCTCHIPELRALNLRTPFIEPQRLMDVSAVGLLTGLCRVALIFPTRQAVTHRSYEGVDTVTSWLSPYTYAQEDPGWTERLDAVLIGVDLIVMHCVGFSEEIRVILQHRYKCPVLIPLRVIAAAIDLIVQENPGS
ncbi:AroM family protein [Nguyenibacter sp. L1]|uniref:AroM family protein n=1 Tax=Nguyenibacter sp. L1 TaxID=3049350 RepID=UPI002B47B0C6|nr:AroM family protein [Nguyenibacter sp. L1]WRH86678.1 AroM family protein [Nguyenibacter sp. L1]